MKRTSALALLMTLSLAACGGHGSSAPGFTPDASLVSPDSRVIGKQDWGGIPTMGQAMLMDAPPLLGGVAPTEVDLGILRIDAVGPRGSVTLAQFASPYVVNVLDYQTTALPFNAVAIHTGQYNKLVITIDGGSSHVVLNGASLPIHFDKSLFAAADETFAAVTNTNVDRDDIVMDVATSINAVPNQTNIFNIDFNAAESLALDDSGQVYAKPTLAAASTDAGVITGSVRNANGGAVAHAVVVARNHAQHIVNSTITDENGNFYLHTVEPGNYAIRVYNRYKNAAGDKVSASGQTSTEKMIRGPRVTVQPHDEANVGTIAD